MKIVTWNCKGAYRKKQKYLLDSYHPDIWIIQECEHPDKFNKETDFQYPENYLWFGENQNKGLAIFSRSGYNLKISKDHTSQFRYVIPVIVSGKIDLIIFAVWAMDAKTESRKQRYIGQIFCALNHYILSEKNTFIIGDYNWNLNFDIKSYGLEGNFSDFLKQMKNLEYQSAYHKFFTENFGKETQPTLFLRGNNQNPYHIDYAFCSKDLIEILNEVKIGKYEKWGHLSDHMPICVTIES